MLKIFNFQSELISKKQLGETIYELSYEVPEEFSFTPGQFISARVKPDHTRAYSIIEIKDNLMTLIVDVMPKAYGGLASLYFEKIQVGELTHFLGPYGLYGIKDTSINKCFISTGSGIAPFISMIKLTREKYPETKIYNFFGVKFEKDDIAFKYLYELVGKSVEYIRCVSREEPKDTFSKAGRVTKVVPESQLDWVNTEFYICGGNAMINDMIEELKKLGADKIHFEKYG